jgi:hypothetical protein
MSKIFLGIRMAREYTWGYICEHCSKYVEFRGSVSKRYGTTATKGILSAGTIFSLTEDGKRTYLEQGKVDFPKVSELFLSDWNNKKYPDDVIGRYSICPRCKKHQHWSKELIDFTPKEEKNIGIKEYFDGGIALSIFVSIIPVIIIFLGSNNIIHKIVISIITFAVLCVICSLVYWFALKFYNKWIKKLSKENEEMENKERHFPQFKEWGNISEETFGLKN